MTRDDHGYVLNCENLKWNERRKSKERGQMPWSACSADLSRRLRSIVQSRSHVSLMYAQMSAVKIQYCTSFEA